MDSGDRALNRRNPIVTHVTILVVALSVVLPATPVLAAKRTDPKIDVLRQTRDAVSKDRQRSAARVNALKSSTRKLAESLSVLAGAKNEQIIRADEAANSEAQANTDARLATVRLELAQQRVTEAERQRMRSAVNAYTGSATKFAVESLERDDLNLAGRRSTYLSVAMGVAADESDRLRAARQDRDIALTDAQVKRRQATAKRKTTAAQLRALQATERQRSRLADAAETRLERALSEAESLAALDTKVSSELTRRQDVLIAAIQADDARALKLRQLLAAKKSPIARLLPPAVPDQPVVRAVEPPAGSLTSVYGITVDASLAEPLRQLIDAAASDGITLRGGGYRNPAQQVALRRAHCGSSDFAVYQARASSCAPPTARPGQSMHEQAMAIDFTANGSLINSRGSAAFQWLKANAGRYGLQNLPSEPWHWSTNGN